VMFERWMQTRDDALLAQIADYNREDCIATLLLRNWLLARRAEALAEFGPIPAAPAEEPRPVGALAAERAALQAQLAAAGEEVAAHLLAYHRREGKPVWWWFFDRVEMTPDELLEDAESIGGL